MAWELDGVTLPGALAAADASTKQFYCMTKNATANQVALATAAGEVIIGVLQNKPDAANDAAEIRSFGITKVIAGEVLLAGVLWGTDASGKAVKVEITGSPNDPLTFVAGTVLVGAAADEYATVTINCMGGWRTSDI